MEKTNDSSCVNVPISYFRKDSFRYKGVRYKKIDGFDNYYITDTGQLISLRRGDPRYMKTWPNQYGHQYVKIPLNGDKVHLSIHREVAKAFVPNPNDYPLVMHIDDDPRNNNYKNLKWGTQTDNMLDCRSKQRDYHRSVYCFELKRTFRSCADAADYFGVTRATITHACQGKSYTACGMHFCYLDEFEERSKDEKFLNKYGNYKQVIAINKETGVIQRFKSRKEASEVLGVNDTGISNVLEGRIKQTGGWIFKEGE